MMDIPKYKACPECGKHNLPSLLECRYCEADLTNIKVAGISAEEAAPASQDAAVSDGRETELVRVCECGTENAPQARKCQACGEDISDMLPTSAKKVEEKLRSYALCALDGPFSLTLDKPCIVVGREAALGDHLRTKLYVSRQHARITMGTNQVFIENLSRTNKTFLNNEEIPDETPVALGNGDEIGLGGKVIDGNRQDKAAYFTFRVQA